MSAVTEHPELLAQYVAGHLEPSRAGDIEAHLERCADCRSEAAALASMRDTLRLQHGAGHVPGEDLVSLVEGDLERAPERRRPIERHLETCADCRDDRLALERVRGAPGSPRVGRCRSSRPGGAPARRLVRIGAVAAGLAAAILLLRTVPGLWTTSTPVPGQARPVTFAAPRRGAEEERVLRIAGPWSITVVLPLGAPEGAYGARVEAADGTVLKGPGAPRPSDGSTLIVPIESLTVGSYRLIIDPKTPAAGAPYVYPFRVEEGRP